MAPGWNRAALLALVIASGVEGLAADEAPAAPAADGHTLAAGSGESHTTAPENGKAPTPVPAAPSNLVSSLAAGTDTHPDKEDSVPVITLLGPNPVMADLDVDTNGWYIDSGAYCYDRIDGQINMRVRETGDIVNLARPGVYKITYKCMNYAGNSAENKVRTVMVSEYYDPGCANITVSGRGDGVHHSSRMGQYLLEYTRCEGDLATGGVDDGPNARCIQVNDGRPIYKQADGPNYLYYHKDEETKFGVWVIDMTDAYEENHMGLQVESKAGKPEDITETWQMATKDGRWTDAPSIKAGCGAREHSENTHGSYQVSCSFVLTGMTAENFGIKERRSFVEAVADALDVPANDITIGSLTNFSPVHGRRLMAAVVRRRLAGKDEQVEVDVIIVGKQKFLENDVLPKLEETLFSNVLLSELKAQEIKLSAAEILPGKTSIQKTPGAKIHDAMMVLLIVALVCGLAAGGMVVQQALKRREQTGVNLTDITAEEKASLTAAMQGNDDPNTNIDEAEGHEDL